MEQQCFVLLASREGAHNMGGEIPLVRVGSGRYVALPLEPGRTIGRIHERVYDAAKGQWTATVAVVPY